MAGSRYGGEQAIPLLRQAVAIGKAFPTFRIVRLEPRKLEMRGRLQPGPSSAKYDVRLVKELWNIPKLWVVKPELALDAPHLFPDRSLCLYDPDDWAWRENQFIARTIVPWAALWLGYYELWLDTGRWLGPEASHTEPERKSA